MKNIKINYDIFHRQYVNHLALTLLANFVKFSAIYKKPHNIHISIKPLILYIFDRLLKLNEKQFEDIFNSKMIKRNYLNKFFIDCTNDFHYFSIECSPDIAKKYNLDNIETINTTYKSYYKVECVGIDKIEYECNKYTTKLLKFYSFNKSLDIEIPFSIIINPTIYKCILCNEFSFLQDILLIKLRNDEYLMLIIPENLFTNEELFYFLHLANITNIVASNVLTSVKILALPLMTGIESQYFNVHSIIEDLDDFKNLFVDKNNDKQKCKTFGFKTNSILEVENTDSLEAFNTNNFNILNGCVSITKPFLYLLLSNTFIVKTGGLYDAHMTQKTVKNRQEFVKNTLHEYFS